MKLGLLEKQVREILLDDPKTRASDDLLYVTLISKMLVNKGFNLERISAKDYLLHYRNYGLPTIESVGRCRRKLQERNESLKPSETVQLHRKEMQSSFYKYAIGDLGLTF